MRSMVEGGGKPTIMTVAAGEAILPFQPASSAGVTVTASVWANPFE